MPSPSSVFTEMVTTTMRNHSKKLVDNVSKNNALLTVLDENGGIKTEDGGTEIVLPLEYAENETYQRYSGLDPLNVQGSDVLTSAKYDWAQIALHVTASGRDLRINNGAHAMIKLVKARTTNAMHTGANGLSLDIYSNGALQNQIGGLDLLVSDDGTGIVGGINATNFPFWKNQFQEMTAPGTYAALKTDMNSLWLKTLRGSDKTNLIVFTHDLYSTYEGGLQDLQRYGDAKMASAGFEALKYKTASVVADDNTNFATTAETGYFLNTKYLYLVQHKDAKWTQDEEKRPTNQDGVVIPIYWMGNAATSNRARQGKLIDNA